MIIHRAMWDNTDHTTFTAFITIDRFNNIPFGVNLQRIDESSDICREIIHEYEAGNLHIEEFYESEKEASAKIRNKRNAILSSTDVYMILDYPISDEQRSQLIEYRKLLRDITNQVGFPKSVVWPDAPSFIK